MTRWKRIRLTLEMIKFEHSIFALPFALTGAMLALRGAGLSGAALGWKIAWIVVCMVSARSAAMTFNRILDADVDAKNPRTRSRHIPAGLLSAGFAWVFTGAAILVFLLAARALNRLCLELAPAALAVMFFYSYTKRFTALSHLVLGFSLGMAPAAAWIAIRGSLDWRIVLLTVAVTLWTAGFDVIYSCQDYEFDKSEGLHSLPKMMGIGPALWVARLFHLGMIVCLGALVQVFALGWLAMAGVSVVVALLAWEHSLVKADDLSRVNAAFFTVNGYVSVLFFVFWAADLYLLPFRTPIWK